MPQPVIPLGVLISDCICSKAGHPASGWIEPFLPLPFVHRESINLGLQFYG